VKDQFKIGADYADMARTDLHYEYHQWRANHALRDEFGGRRGSARQYRDVVTDGNPFHIMTNEMPPVSYGLGLTEADNLSRIDRLINLLPHMLKKVEATIPANLATLAREVEADWLDRLRNPQPKARLGAIRWVQDRLQQLEGMMIEVSFIPRRVERENMSRNSEAMEVAIRMARWMAFECRSLVRRYFENMMPEESLSFLAINESLKHLDGLHQEIQAYWLQFGDWCRMYHSGPYHSSEIDRGIANMPSESALRISLVLSQLELWLRIHRPDAVAEFNADTFVRSIRSLGLLMMNWVDDERVGFMVLPWIQIHTENSHIHRSDGPAIEWSGMPPPMHGGLKAGSAYFIEGYEVDELAVMNPELISLDSITNEWNVEVRRILIGLYGWERYLENTQALVLDVAVVTAGGSAWMETLFDVSRGRVGKVLLTYDPSTSGRFALAVPDMTFTCHQAQVFLSGMDSLFAGLGKEMQESANMQKSKNPYPMIRT
jgi:hypothetical protein